MLADETWVPSDAPDLKTLSDIEVEVYINETSSLTKAFLNEKSQDQLMHNLTHSLMKDKPSRQVM